MDYQYKLPSGLYLSTEIEPIRSRLSFLVVEKTDTDYQYIALVGFDELDNDIVLDEDGEIIAIALLDDFITFPPLQERYDQLKGEWTSNLSALEVYCSKKNVLVDEALTDFGKWVVSMLRMSKRRIIQ